MELQNPTGHTGAVLAVAVGTVDGDAVMIVSGGDDAKVRLWGRPHRPAPRPDGRPQSGRSGGVRGHRRRLAVIISGGGVRGLVGTVRGVGRTQRPAVDRPQPTGWRRWRWADRRDPVIVSRSSDGTVPLCDARPLSLLSVIPALVEVHAVAVIPGGVAIGAGFSVLVIDVPGLHPPPAHSLAATGEPSTPSSSFRLLWRRLKRDSTHRRE
ncbi:MAG: WD40 repeat domain-containing protein [Egibacteraceae bacterium]